MVAVGVVARRVERSAASVIETRFTEALRRTRSGATRQPTASNPIVSVCAESARKISCRSGSSQHRYNDTSVANEQKIVTKISGEDGKGQSGKLAGSRFAFPRNSSARLEAGVRRSRSFSTGKREHRGQVSRFSSAMTRTKMRRALRPLVTCVRACRRSTLNSFQTFQQRFVPAILIFPLNSYLSERNFLNESTVPLGRMLVPSNRPIPSINSFLRFGQT